MNSVLKNLEDPQRPFIGPNYWLLTVTGFILPKNKVAKILYLILHELVTAFVVTQYAELYFIRSDFDHVLTNLRFSLLALICIAKANSFVIWQSKWRDVMEYITTADKFERNNLDPAREIIVNGYTKYCRKITYFYWSLVFVTYFNTTLTPLMQYASSQTLRENVRNGTQYFPHIFSAWVPFDKEQPPGCWIAFVTHCFMSMYGALTMACYDTCIVVIMMFFGGQFDLLRERCKEMFGSLEVGISDKECKEVIRQLHGMHMMMIKYSRLFNSLLSPVMFIYLMVSSFTLCALAFQFTTATNTAQKLMAAEYVAFGIAQLFLYCWHSNSVYVKNENVSSRAYESKWWAANNSQRKNVLILLGQLRIKSVFTAGPFVNLTLATFINILKGAYSYYTLVRK